MIAFSELHCPYQPLRLYVGLYAYTDGKRRHCRRVFGWLEWREFWYNGRNKKEIVGTPITIANYRQDLPEGQLCRYFVYSPADFGFFRPTGATRCTDQGQIWP